MTNGGAERDRNSEKGKRARCIVPLLGSAGGQWGLGVEADAADAPTVLRIFAQDTSCSQWISGRQGAAGFAEGFPRKLV